MTKEEHLKDRDGRGVIDDAFGRFATKQDLSGTEDRLIEAMRKMQTELLRGIASLAEAQTLRLRKVEADQSNLDTAISGRMNVMENRLLQIEIRLGLKLLDELPGGAH